MRDGNPRFEEGDAARTTRLTSRAAHENAAELADRVVEFARCPLDVSPEQSAALVTWIELLGHAEESIRSLTRSEIHSALVMGVLGTSAVAVLCSVDDRLEWATRQPQ